nr:uncharacterized protein LOC131788602 isoform X2 [Pocillopora verrucosa]
MTMIFLRRRVKLWTPDSLVSHSNHLNSGPNRDLSKKCTHARGSACVLMDEDEADVDVEFASGGDLEKVSISPSSCTPTSKENGSIKETPKSSKKGLSTMTKRR